MIHKTIDFVPGMNNPEHQHRSKTNWLRNQQPQGKKRELHGDAKLSVSQGHILTAHRANHTWTVFIRTKAAVDQCG